METSRRERRVSARQLDLLWEFLNYNKNIAAAHNRSMLDKEYSKSKWMDIAHILNCQVDGAHKDWRSWSKYWVDYKAKLKIKVAAARSSHVQTGGGPSTVRPLNEMDEKFLVILGKDFGKPGVKPLLETHVSASSKIASLRPLNKDLFDDIHRKAIDRNQSKVSSDIRTTLQPRPPEIESITLGTKVEEGTDVEDFAPLESVPPMKNGIIQNSIEEIEFVEPPPQPVTSPSPSSQAATPPPSQRRRHPRRKPYLSHAAARRALVQSSQMRAEAAVRNSEAMQEMAQHMSDIKRAVEKTNQILGQFVSMMSENLT